MALWVVCDRLINEVTNERCIRDARHSGPCSSRHRDWETDPSKDWDRAWEKFDLKHITG